MMKRASELMLGHLHWGEVLRPVPGERVGGGDGGRGGELFSISTLANGLLNYQLLKSKRIWCSSPAANQTRRLQAKAAPAPFCVADYKEPL